jgi:hypothetical protein
MSKCLGIENVIYSRLKLVVLCHRFFSVLLSFTVTTIVLFRTSFHNYSVPYFLTIITHML